MQVDHIFIFSARQGNEAQALVNAGFTEGSSRIHPGQGTVNRKFYFENFFLEILWIHNEEEIKSPGTNPTKLWERSQFRINNYSRFGVCLVNTETTDTLFKTSKIYEPQYFPQGMVIDFIAHDSMPWLPWTFRLPYRGQSKKVTEPTQQALKIQQLTQVTFNLPYSSSSQDFTRFFNNHSTIDFQESNYPQLLLEFDHKKQGKSIDFPALDLLIEY